MKFLHFTVITVSFYNSIPYQASFLGICGMHYWYVNPLLYIDSNHPLPARPRLKINRLLILFHLSDISSPALPCQCNFLSQNSKQWLGRLKSYLRDHKIECRGLALSAISSLIYSAKNVFEISNS